MNMPQFWFKVVVLVAGLTGALALVTAHAADSAPQNIEGVIMSRDGDNLVLRGAESGANNVTITKSTYVYQLKGPLGLGFLSGSSSPDILVPGLNIVVEPESITPKIVAKSIRFSSSDLNHLYAIQGALAAPQAQIQALQQEVAAQKQELAAQKQELAAQKQQNANQDQALAAINKRFTNLADYDPKAELVIVFDVNSATVSDKAKTELKAFADKSKAYRGYLIQVVGYADAAGSAGSNQMLSNRRAGAVASYLQQECDVALSRVLVPIAMGESKPTASNETAQGRAENRRVTVKLGVNRGIGE